MAKIQVILFFLRLTKIRFCINIQFIYNVTNKNIQDTRCRAISIGHNHSKYGKNVKMECLE